MERNGSDRRNEMRWRKRGRCTLGGKCCKNFGGENVM